jgi:hypothetical protein
MHQKDFRKAATEKMHLSTNLSHGYALIRFVTQQKESTHRFTQHKQNDFVLSEEQRAISQDPRQPIRKNFKLLPTTTKIL